MGLDQLAPLLGTWQGSEQCYDSAYGAGGPARAILSWRFEVGETLVVQDYRQVRADGSEFAGHGVFLAEGGQIRWWFFDSTGQVPIPAVGSFAADGLILTKHTPRGTAVHRWQLIGDELRYAIAVGAPEAKPIPFLAGRYRRLNTH